MKHKLLSLFAIVSVIVIPLLAAQESGSGADAGRQLYTAYQCWQCHGYEGQGGAAPRIGPTVYPFEAFAAFVRHSNEMPAYSPNVLSDADLRRIYEFVRTQPVPPAAAEIPALRDL